jgi:antitoxin ParD1/3/4
MYRYVGSGLDSWTWRCPFSSLLGLLRRHKLSYYDGMAMKSLNISLPQALKEYVEGQVASGDWGTPSEYVRELIRQDKERGLGNLEQELVASARRPQIEISVAEIREKGLVGALREQVRRAGEELRAVTAKRRARRAQRRGWRS